MRPANGGIEAADAPPLLIDQDGGVPATDGRPQRRNEGADLGRIRAIAFEEDEAQGVRILEEAAFLVA